MAIIKFVKVKKGNLKAILNYITKPEKTTNDLIYCKNCNIKYALEQFKYIKELYNQKGGRQYYHIIQSFSPKDNIDYELANKIGQQMCEYFKGYQIVLATHKDTEHINNHFVMNSVNFENGKKYQQSKNDLKRIKMYSNELCAKYNLSQINLENSKVSKYEKLEEYHLSKKEETEKSKLIKAINNCIKNSKTKNQFIYNMSLLGYKVKWQDDRKYITYTTPLNRKFRDKRLKNEKYSKDRMEKYFKKLENKNKFIKVINNVSYLITPKQDINNTKKDINSFEFSDIVKKDYIKSKENASSIEWE